MTVTLEEVRRERLIRGLQGLYQTEFAEEISPFRANQVLDFFLGALGPQIYNQAVHDARGSMQQRLDDLDGEIYVPEKV